MEVAEEDAWEDFKSTPEPIAAAEGPVSVGSNEKPRDAGEGSELSRAHPLQPSGDNGQHQHQLDATEGLQSVRKGKEGGKDVRHARGEGGLALPHPYPTAAAAAEDAVELNPGTMAPSIGALSAVAEALPQAPRQHGGAGDGVVAIDLLDMLPSSTDAAPGGNAAGDGGDGNTVQFGSILPSFLKNAEEITGTREAFGNGTSLGTTGAVALDLLQRGDAGDSILAADHDEEKADDGKVEGGWGLFERPEPEPATATSATETAASPAASPAAPPASAAATAAEPMELGFAWQGEEEGASSAPLAEAVSPPAEKVDGEWIDLARPQDGDEQDGDEQDGDEQDVDRGDEDGTGDTPATSDGGTVAVDRDEEEPRQLSDSDAESKRVSMTAGLVGENGQQEPFPVACAAAAISAEAAACPTDAAHDGAPAVPAKDTELRTTAADTIALFADAGAGAGADEDKRRSRSTEGPADRGPKATQDGGLLEAEPAVFSPLREGGNEPGEDVDVVGVVAAEGQMDPMPLPAVADQPVPALPAAAMGGSSVVPAADVFDWGDFGGAAVGGAEAEDLAGAAITAPSESPSGSGDTGQQAKHGEGDEEDGQGEEEDEWLAFEAPPTPSAAETTLQQALSTSLRPGEGGVSMTESAPAATGKGAQEGESDGGRPELVPAAPAGEVDQSGPSESFDGVPPGAKNTPENNKDESAEAAVPSTSPAPSDPWGGLGHAERGSPSPLGEAAEHAGGEWGAFGHTGASGVSPPGEAPEPAKNDGGAEKPGDGEPAVDGGDGEQGGLPPAVPELGGVGGGELSSSSWGAFDEAPVAVVPATATAPVETEATAGGGDVVEQAEEILTESREISSATAANGFSTDNAGRGKGREGSRPAVAVVEPLEEESSTVEDAVGDGAGATVKEVKAPAKPMLEVEAGAGVSEAMVDGHAEEAGKDDGGGDQDQSEREGDGEDGNDDEDDNDGNDGNDVNDGNDDDDDDDWGSDFGDFEEAPTPQEESEPAIAGDNPGTTAADSSEMGATPKPPVTAVRNLPPSTESSGGERVDAVKGGVADPIAATTMSVGAVSAAMAGGEGPSLMAVMVAVFDMAFVDGGSAGVPRRAPSAAGGTESAQEVSLDSLVDLAYLLRHARPSRRCRGAPRLNEWATRCVLRGIRPVPDALRTEDGDDENEAVAHTSSRRSGDHGVRPYASQAAATATTTAVPPPSATSRVVSPSRAPRQAPASPAVRAAAVSSRVVSPSPAPPPLRSPLEVEKEPSADEQQPATERASTARIKRPFTPEFKTGGARAGAQTVAEVEKKAGAPIDPAVEAEAIAASTTPSFASFPSAPSAEPPAGQKPPPPPPPPVTVDDEEDDEFVWGEAVSEVTTPEMPRQAPPRVPLTPSEAAAAEGGEDKDLKGGEGDKDKGIRFDGAAPPPPPVDGGDGDVAVAVVADSAAGADAFDDDGGNWSDDPFDSFQSAPAAAPLSSPPLGPPPLAPPPTGLAERAPSAVPAAAPARADTTTPPPPQSSWNLDFLMATPSTGIGGGGRLSPLPGMESAKTSAGGEGQSGKPMDLVSQALAGFGIENPDGASGTTAHRNKNEDGGDFFAAFAGGSVGALAVGGSNNKSHNPEDRGRVSGVDVADLLRATQLRGGARRGSRPRESLSAAAESRLAALPDLSYMLSQRICFPMRAAMPMPSTAGEVLP